MNARVVLMLNFLMIIVIPLLFIGILTFENTTRAFGDEVTNRLDAAATTKDARIEAAVERNYERISMMATRRQLRISLASYIDGNTQEQDRIEQTMNEVKASVTDFREVLFADNTGEVLFSTERWRVGQSIVHDTYFSEGIKGAYVSEVTEDADGTPIFYLATPIIQANRTVGVMIALSDARVLLRIANDRTGLGKTGETYLFKRAQNGTLVFITQNGFSPSDPLYPLATRTLDQHWSGTAEVSPEHQLIAVTRYSSAGWGMIVTTNKQEAFAPLVQMRTTFIIIVLIVVAFTILIAWIISRSVAEPVTEITRVIEEISKGKLDARIDPRLKEATDEIRDLAAAFDRTIVSIKLATKRNAECVIREDDTKDLIVLDEKHHVTAKKKSK